MHTKFFTFQLENDRRTVETSLLFKVNFFFSEIRLKTPVDSNHKKTMIEFIITVYLIKILRSRTRFIKA